MEAPELPDQQLTPHTGQMQPSSSSTEPGRQQGSAEPGCWQRCRGAPSPGVPAVSVQEPPTGCAQSRAHPRCRRQHRSAGTAHGALTVTPCPPPTFTPFLQELGAGAAPRVLPECPRAGHSQHPPKLCSREPRSPGGNPVLRTGGSSAPWAGSSARGTASPPPKGRGTRIQGAAPPFREHDAILGSSTPSRRAAPQSREQQPNPGEQNPSAGSRTPSRGAASQHGEQQPHPRQQNPNAGSATPSRRAAPPRPRGRRPQGAPPVPATPPQQDSRAAAEGCAGRCCARERALCTLGRPTPS